MLMQGTAVNSEHLKRLKCLKALFAWSQHWAVEILEGLRLLSLLVMTEDYLIWWKQHVRHSKRFVRLSWRPQLQSSMVANRETKLEEGLLIHSNWFPTLQSTATTTYASTSLQSLVFAENARNGKQSAWGASIEKGSKSISILQKAKLG